MSGGGSHVKILDYDKRGMNRETILRDDLDSAKELETSYLQRLNKSYKSNLESELNFIKIPCLE